MLVKILIYKPGKDRMKKEKHRLTPFINLDIKIKKQQTEGRQAGSIRRVRYKRTGWLGYRFILLFVKLYTYKR